MLVLISAFMKFDMHDLRQCPQYHSFIKVMGPFVQTLCIEKDSYMNAIQRVNIFR